MENLQPFDWFQNMSRVSMIGRLQRGHEPRLSHSSLEQTLQKVCPQGINAAPFFLPIHTQHTESLPVNVPNDAVDISVSLPSSSTPSAVSSSNLINDTLLGVISTAGSPRLYLSASKAVARFIPEPDPVSDPVTNWISLCSWISSSLEVGLWRVALVVVLLRVGPQHAVNLNLNRSLRVRFLLVRSATLIWRRSRSRNVVVRCVSVVILRVVPRSKSLIIRLSSRISSLIVKQTDRLRHERVREIVYKLGGGLWRENVCS